MWYFWKLKAWKLFASKRQLIITHYFYFFPISEEAADSLIYALGRKKRHYGHLYLTFCFFSSRDDITVQAKAEGSNSPKTRAPELGHCRIFKRKSLPRTNDFDTGTRFIVNVNFTESNESNKLDLQNKKLIDFTCTRRNKRAVFNNIVRGRCNRSSGFIRLNCFLWCRADRVSYSVLNRSRTELVSVFVRSVIASVFYVCRPATVTYDIL